MSQMHLVATGPPSAHDPANVPLPHILFVVDCFPKTLGGGERIALRLAELLPQAGFRASVLTFAIHPESTFRPEDAPCPVYLLPLRSTYGLDAVRGALALRGWLRREKIVLVQTFFESSDLWAGLVVRLFSSAKLIWSRRDMGILRQRKHDFGYRLLRGLPHAVLAVSARVADHVIAVDRVKRAKVHVVYNGLDLPSLSASRPVGSEGDPVVTTIGNVRPVKGHDILIEAAAEVLAVRPDVRFTVAGDVLDREFYQQLAARLEVLGIQQRFVFLGKISDLGAHLAGVSVFVLPSRSEGFSNALIEAMAGGVPVIATDVGGNAEAVQHGHSGLIVPTEDPKALATAILTLLGSPAYAEQLRCHAWETVRREFTAAAMLAKVAQIYRELLAK